MATYKSEKETLGYSAERVFDKLSNLEGLKEILANVPADQIPEEQKAQLEQIQVTADTISFPAGPVGALTLQVTERIRPTLIRLEGIGAPVPMSLAMHIEPVDDAACRAEVEINLDIPMMLKPMVNGPLKKMTEQFAQMIKMIPF